MNILLIGAGGREHALAWAIAASPLCDRLYAAPGNPGIAGHAQLAPLDVTDHGAVATFCREKDIGLVTVGPEAPLVAGIADDLAASGIKVFGPQKFASQLEGSKGFCKELCARNGIPTAAFARFRDRNAALAYVAARGAPIVVKADGLAAGKGVTVATSVAEARAAIDAVFAGKFGAADCVIEDCLEGEEASYFALCDGAHVLPLATAQDHKRVGEGDTGPNTGGMGAYSPAPCMTEAVCAATLERIVRPIVRALSDMGHPYVGVLYAGVMLTRDGPQLIEVNVRFGDPEAQALLPRLKDDIVTLMLACVDGTLDRVSVRWHAETALAVVMCAKGYPGEFVKGSEIRGLERAAQVEGVEIFHAGTAIRDGRLVAVGGRVLNVAALAKSVKEAQARAYAAVDRIDWPEGFCRRDIGWRAR
jgi:phosphoribosylamine--glycine ligase